MKKMSLYGLHGIDMAVLTGDVTGQEDAEASVYALLHHALFELAELKRELATSRLNLKDAQQHIETLAETNRNLKQKLIRLAKKCTEARHFGYHDELSDLIKQADDDMYLAKTHSELQKRYFEADLQNT